MIFDVKSVSLTAAVPLWSTYRYEPGVSTTHLFVTSLGRVGQGHRTPLTIADTNLIDERGNPGVSFAVRSVLWEVYGPRAVCESYARASAWRWAFGARLLDGGPVTAVEVHGNRAHRKRLFDAVRANRSGLLGARYYPEPIVIPAGHAFAIHVTTEGWPELPEAIRFTLFATGVYAVPVE